MRKFFFFCLYLLCAYPLAAQDKLNIKFGKITPPEFEVVSPLVDSNVNAVVLSDIGSSEFVGNNKGFFSLVFKKHKRIKILNNKGFDAAEVAVYLYSNGQETEKLEDIRANTYNLENGAVVTTKLESKSIFEEKISKRSVKKKFTFPAVKPGSIIEYSYTIKSDFIFNLQPWEFQGELPCLWSEYNVSIPDFFNYVFLSQGYLNFDVKKNNERFEVFTTKKDGGAGSSDEKYALNTTVHDLKWVIRNVPPIKEESFTSTINNHIAKIEFQLSQYRFPGQPVEDVMGAWPKVSEKMLKREDFGLAFNRGNGWMDDEMKIIEKGAATKEEKVRKIYEFIRDKFTCTNMYGIYLSDNTSLKDIFKKKSGSVSELNLLLLGMLRHDSIASEPVLMSLRSRGLIHPVYPLMDRFNYLVCEVNIGDKFLYLDASRPMLGYNKLPASCYNGTAWVLAEQPTPIALTPDSLKEEKLTSIFIINDAKDGVVGAFNSRLGYYESYGMREKMSKTKKEDFLKEITKGFGTEIKVENLQLDSLSLYDEPVSVRYDFKMNNDEDMVYFNPMFGEGMQKNPFTSAHRFYPVEMPYTSSEVFILDMEVPRGYTVEEVPKSVRYKLNEDEGLFEYLCVKTPEKIQLRSKIVISKANFQQDDYQPLRDFFSFIIKKQSEQIVFKKIK